MFDVLVESNGEKGRGAKQGAYFGTTALVLGSLFIGLFVYSLYQYNLGSMSADDLSLDTLVAPVMAEEAPPPPPAPENQPKKQVQTDAPKNFDVLKDPVRNIEDSTTPPDKPSTEKSTATPIRPGVAHIQGNETSRASGEAGPERTSSAGTGGGAPIKSTPPPIKDTEDAPPPPKPVEKPKPSVVSGGVINGKASRLVQPPYPPAAKAVHASGTVNVQVLIDESGNVVSASATSGNPLLRAAAVQAARSSKFTPTQLSGTPVKVSGIIVYNFVAQ